MYLRREMLGVAGGRSDVSGEVGDGGEGGV